MYNNQEGENILKNCIMVNLFGGAGIGKTTQAARLFVMCKEAGLNVEYADEYVKPMIYEGRSSVLNCQAYIFGKQLWKVQRLAEKVDIVITDSPILLSTIYDPDQNINFRKYSMDMFNKFNNINVMLIRNDSYFKAEGRYQKDISEAKVTDNEIEALLFNYEIPYRTIESSEEGCKELLKVILSKL